MNFQDNKNIWACKRLWPWIQTTDSLNSKYHSLWFWIQITEFKIKFCDFESPEFKSLNSKSFLWFWLQITEFKIKFCDFEFKSLNSKSYSAILNSNPWIQKHFLWFWIQIHEFKIICLTSLHRLECMPVEAAIFWAYTGFFTDLQFFFHSWKSLEDAQSWQIYSRSTCHTPSHHAAQPVCWASPWASSGYGALPTLSAPSCGTWCVQSCMHGQGRRLYSSNHEAHHSQGPELIDHRHIHLTWESNFIFMLMCMFWALTKYILNDEIIQGTV